MGDPVEKPVFNALDRRVARLVAGRCSKNREVVELIVSLVSYQLRQGHVCLDLYSDPPARGLNHSSRMAFGLHCRSSCRKVPWLQMKILGTSH